MPSSHPGHIPETHSSFWRIIIVCLTCYTNACRFSLIQIGKWLLIFISVHRKGNLYQDLLRPIHIKFFSYYFLPGSDFFEESIYLTTLPKDKICYYLSENLNPTFFSFFLRYNYTTKYNYLNKRIFSQVSSGKTPLVRLLLLAFATLRACGGLFVALLCLSFACRFKIKPAGQKMAATTNNQLSHLLACSRNNRRASSQAARRSEQKLARRVIHEVAAVGASGPNKLASWVTDKVTDQFSARFVAPWGGKREKLV